MLCLVSISILLLVSSTSESFFDRRWSKVSFYCSVTVTLLPYPSLYFSPFSAVNTSPSIFSFNSYSFTSTLHYLLLFLCANPPLFCFFFGSYVHLVVSYVLKVRLKKDILMESSFRSMQYLPLAWSTFISSITSRLVTRFNLIILFSSNIISLLYFHPFLHFSFVQLLFICSYFFISSFHSSKFSSISLSFLCFYFSSLFSEIYHSNIAFIFLL
ncbi:unnamed protein product [Acanthosepion pharaonis]|uniref:Uncharacterized protein n=1 Tax=Acanthosepion pharaonis TaxID=158019 RepID=A0A812DVI6_ACAPH|nr:unnamed protein product [Sepia pharaonis]